MQKKYTIIYSFQLPTHGSHRHYVTKYAQVETSDLKSVLDQEEYYGNIWFVFDGWCNITKD